MSFPAAASISTPPAVAVRAIAASSVPFVFTRRISSFPAVSDAATTTYASKSAFPNVKSFPFATFIVIPPATDDKLIAVLLVPFVFVTEIVSAAPTLVDNEIASASLVLETTAI